MVLASFMWTRTNGQVPLCTIYVRGAVAIYEEAQLRADLFVPYAKKKHTHKKFSPVAVIMFDFLNIFFSFRAKTMCPTVCDVT